MTVKAGEFGMTIGEQIQKIRKQKKIPVEQIAAELGVSKTTIYRYEDSSIEKIPVKTFEKLCRILGVSSIELLGNVEETNQKSEFRNAKEAMEYILKTPVLAEYAGYELSEIQDETIAVFAEELLKQLEFAVYKYQSKYKEH